MIASTCIALVAGATQLVLPTTEVTLRWWHSVEGTGWEEDYRATPEGLSLDEARIESMGAGLEPPASAVREGKWWRYRPSLPILRVVAFANSSFVAGYAICWSGRCRPLDDLVQREDRFALRTEECAGIPLTPSSLSSPSSWATP